MTQQSSPSAAPMPGNDTNSSSSTGQATDLTAREPSHYWGIFPMPRTNTPLGLHQGLLLCAATSAVLLVSPPRTFGRSCVLGGLCLVCVMQLRYDWTGKRWHERGAAQWVRSVADPSALPPAAVTARERLRREKDLKSVLAMQNEQERLNALRRLVDMERERKRVAAMPDGPEKTAELLKLRAQELTHARAHGNAPQMSFWQRLWMGSESEDWEYRRWKEHRHMIESGAGVWGAMKHDIREALGLDRPKEGNGNNVIETPKK